MGSVLFVILTVTMTAVAVWFFGPGEGRDSQLTGRERPYEGQRDR